MSVCKNNAIILLDPTMEGKTLENYCSNLYEDDQNLRRKFLMGDRESQEILMTRYGQLIRRISRILTGKWRMYFMTEDADDLVQNVMLRFGSIVQNYENNPLPVPFGQYIVGCIRNVAFDMVKKEKLFRKSRTELSDFQRMRSRESPGARSCTDAELLVETIDIRRRLSELDERNPLLGNIIVDYYWFSFNDTELAEKSGLTRNQMWRTRQEALRALADKT